MLHMHAPVFGPYKHPPADERAVEGPDAELPAAERASDAARTRNSLGGTLIQVHRQTCAALLDLQTTVAHSLSSSVAQSSPPSVARRSAQKKGLTRVQNEGTPLPARGGADFAGHAGVRHLVHKCGLSSKHAALAQHAAKHANNGRAFRTKQCASRRRLQAAIAVTISAAEVNETASDCAPLGRKDAVGNSTVRFNDITRELVEGIVLESVEDTVQQPAKDFAAHVPARSSEFERKYAHKTVRHSVGVCSAHLAASEYAALRHCRHEYAPRDAPRSVEACRTRTRRQHHGPCLSALRALFQVLPLTAMWQTLAVEAVFTPRTRAELQGNGAAGGGGVFGCVGACGQGLLTGSSGYTYCHWDANGPWESG